MNSGPSLRDLYLFNICLGKQEVALGKEMPLYSELDEEVYVQLYSQKDTGRGHVIELPDEDVRFKPDCRYKVRFLNGSTHNVRVQRILPVVRGPAIIITAETEDFRHLCRTQVDKGDVVLEIGCSYGKATKILCEQAGETNVVGVDLGLEALESCAKICGARFEHVDIVSCSEEETAQRLAELRALLPQMPPSSPDRRQCRFVVFVDIGGDRMASALQRVIPRIVRAQQPHQIIIKSRELLTSLVAEGTLPPSLIQGAYRPMHKPPYGVTTVSSSIFLTDSSAQIKADIQHSEDGRRASRSEEAYPECKKPLSWDEKLKMLEDFNQLYGHVCVSKHDRVYGQLGRSTTVYIHTYTRTYTHTHERTKKCRCIQKIKKRDII